MATCGAIILAAGPSTRLGQSKQLLNYSGKSLLQHSVESALQSSASPVIVVIGANEMQVKKDIQHAPVTIVVNEEWQEGMAASIRCGLHALLKLTPTIDAAIIMVCDQPFVSSALLHHLINQHLASGQPLVASAYDDTVGTPVLFHHQFFPNLLQLQGNEGAKQLLKQHYAEVATIPFPLGTIDIDTPQDYGALLQNKSDIAES